MIEENKARTAGKRVRPEAKREGGRRLVNPSPAETDEVLDEFEDALSAFDLGQMEAAPEEAVLGDLPEEEAECSHEPEEEAFEPASAPGDRLAGRRVRPDQEGHRLWNRAMDACTDLADRMLDWTEDLTDRFDEMASDPENDSLAARFIRSSEDIVDGLEEQQRETDDENDVEERMRSARGQHKREIQPQAQPKFVFYTAENPDTPVDLKELAKARQKTIGQPKKENRPEAEREETPQPNVGEETPAEDEGLTPESLISQLGVAPATVEEEPQPGKRMKKSRESRRVEERIRTEEPPRREEKPVRQPPVRTPIPKEERRQVIRITRKLQYWAFLLVLGFFGILGLLGPLRADVTEVENRPLTEKPALSVVGLWSGDYFGRLEQWYSDTYPMRDRLAGVYDFLSPLGFGPVAAVSGAAENNPDVQELAGGEPSGESQLPDTEAPNSSAPAENE